MYDNHHRIVGFRVSCFCAFFTPLPCHEKICVFLSGNFMPPKKKNPRGDAAGESLPQNYNFRCDRTICTEIQGQRHGVLGPPLRR